jgi:hypothetical protein
MATEEEEVAAIIREVYLEIWTRIQACMTGDREVAA